MALDSAFNEKETLIKALDRMGELIRTHSLTRQSGKVTHSPARRYLLSKNQPIKAPCLGGKRPQC